MDPTTSGVRQLSKKRSKRPPTTIHALSQDILVMIFSLLDLLDLFCCSAVCRTWSEVIDKLKSLEVQQGDFTGILDKSAGSGRSMKIHLGQLVMEQHKFALQDGGINIYQWEGSSKINQCRMKMGKVLTGVGDKVICLWSVGSYECLDRYFLPDKAPLIDFDFDESKVVGLVGTRICIWKREEKEILSSRENFFIKGLCMRYVDPVAVVGCEDGKARVFDMYSRRCSQIIKMYDAPLACLSLTDDQLIVGGSSFGNILISDLSSGARVAKLSSTASTGYIKTLCYNPSTHLLFAGSTAGYASCWDLRTMRNLWASRVSSNVLYSMDHLRSDRSALVVGGIDGVLRVVDQDGGRVLSRCIMDENSSGSSRSNDSYKVIDRAGQRTVIERKNARRLSEDTRIDLLPIACRPPITSLAVGMQKVVTVHNDKYIRVWKFDK